MWWSVGVGGQMTRSSEVTEEVELDGAVSFQSWWMWSGGCWSEWSCGCSVWYRAWRFVCGCQMAWSRVGVEVGEAGWEAVMARCISPCSDMGVVRGGGMVCLGGSQENGGSGPCWGAGGFLSFH